MEFENPFNDTVKFVFGVIEMMFDDSIAVFCKSFLGMARPFEQSLYSSFVRYFCWLCWEVEVGFFSLTVS